MEREHLECLETQVRALDAEIERVSRCEPYRQTVEALQCLRGAKTLTAMTLVLERRRQGQDPATVVIAVKAEYRLSKKFERLWARKHPNVAVVSVARELCGFVWVIMRTAPQQS